MAKNTNKKNTAGKVTLACGVIALAFSTAFLVMNLMGVEVIQENSGVIQNIIGIAVGAYLTYRGRVMLKSDD